MKNYKFPKRFEIEGLDPLTLKVKVVGLGEAQIFDNMEAAEAALPELVKMAGPMADKIQVYDNLRGESRSVWCIRFESWEAYDTLSV